MYVYDSINTVYVRLCTLMTTVMSFTLLDSHKPNSASANICLHELNKKGIYFDFAVKVPVSGR